MAKEQFLHIRLSRKDKERVQTAATANYLDMSTWARMVIMQSVERAERERAELASPDA